MTAGTHLPGVLGPLATIARALWFLAWSVLAGTTAWAWAFGDGATLDPQHASAVGSLWRGAARQGWAWTAKATLLSLLVTVIAAVTGPSASAIKAETLVGAGILGLGLALLRPAVRRLSSGEPASGRAFARDRWALTSLLVPVALGAAMMAPTRTRAWEGVRAAVAAAHLASAGVWLGTIGLFVVLMRSTAWKSLPAPTAPLRPLVRPVVETAARAAAVLVVSGVVAAAISHPGLGGWASDYSALLAAKAAVLAVAVGIAWRQWVVVHGRSQPRGLLATATVEAVALLCAAGMAAALLGVDPFPAASAAPSRVGLTAAPACMAATPRQDCDAATIRTEVAGAPATQLGTVLPLLCTADGAKPHAFTYFACLEAVGQALVAREGNAPTPALTDCTAYTDGWAGQSCAAGVFSGLLTVEAGAAPSADAHSSDPVWPCRAVTDEMAPPCYLLAPTRVLWLNGGDGHAAFATCDGLSAEWEDLCYQGTGREITTRAGYRVAGIVVGCGSAGALGPGPCLAGAARTLVFTRHGDAAAALCAGAGPVSGPACESERQAALATM